MNKNEIAKNFNSEIAEQIAKIRKLPEIRIEICGTWVWVKGNTRPVAVELRLAGYQWSKNKQSWYWHHDLDNTQHAYKGKYTLQEVREKYPPVEIKKCKAV